METLAQASAVWLRRMAVVPPALLAVWLLVRLPEVAAGRAWAVDLPWVPTLGVNFAVRVDGLAMLFALLVTVIGTLVFLYTLGYLRGHPMAGRCITVMLLFMGSMLGLVVADDVVLMYVFWELTTLASFLLIATEHRRSGARRAAMQALVVTAFGGLALLGGLAMLIHITGTTKLSAMITMGGVQDHPWYPAILTLVLLAAFTKSAQVPFHFWLPNAMTAPTPVSAYLHSATMVKAGIYLLARLHPVLADSAAWTAALASVGALSMVWGGLMALRETDLKRMLAHTTVMGLGAIVMFLGGHVRIALIAAITYMLVHALYKSSLFMVAGAIEHQVGVRGVRRLGGLAGAMPLTCAAAVAAALSMSGFPPFLGFFGKELKYEGALAISGAPFTIAAAAVAANAMITSVALTIAIGVFFQNGARRHHLPRAAREAPPSMWSAAGVLAAMGLALGLTPHLTGDWLLQPAVRAMVQSPEPVTTTLLAGTETALLMSVFTMVLGVGLFLLRGRVRPLVSGMVRVLPLRAGRGYLRVLIGLEWLGHSVLAAVQNGRLDSYTRVMLAFAAAVAWLALIGTGRVMEMPAHWLAPTAYEWGLVVLPVVAAVAVVRAESRLLAVVALSVVGTAIGLIYMLYGAPDVAITQLLVETLLLIVLASVLLRLPGFRRARHLKRRTPAVDAAIAAALGGSVAVALLAATAGPAPTMLPAWFGAHALPDAHGRNVVNVILTDFRALDTLGEITVLMVAGLGAVGLVRLGLPRRGGSGGKEAE